MQFHPAAQILTWCLLVVSMQVLTLDILLAPVALILSCAIAMAGVAARAFRRAAGFEHYAEAAMLREAHSWQDALRGLFEPHGETARHMELPLYRFSAQDALLVAVSSLYCGWQ